MSALYLRPVARSADELAHVESGVRFSLFSPVSQPFLRAEAHNFDGVCHDATRERFVMRHSGELPPCVCDFLRAAGAAFERLLD